MLSTAPASACAKGIRHEPDSPNIGEWTEGFHNESYATLDRRGFHPKTSTWVTVCEMPVGTSWYMTLWLRSSDEDITDTYCGSTKDCSSSSVEQLKGLPRPWVQGRLGTALNCPSWLRTRVWAVLPAVFSDIGENYSLTQSSLWWTAENSVWPGQPFNSWEKTSSTSIDCPLLNRKKTLNLFESILPCMAENALVFITAAFRSILARLSQNARILTREKLR